MTDYHPANIWGQQTAAFSPRNPSFQRDYSGVNSPNITVNRCKDLLQHPADFYSTLNSPCDSMSSSGSDSSDRSKPERCVSSTSSGGAEVTSDKIERRRKQNRISQRAQRERKERYQKNLEEQIAQEQQKLQLLTRSYSQQTEKIATLKAQIEQLVNEISQLQSPVTFCGSLCPSQEEFNLAPCFDADALRPQERRHFKARWDDDDWYLSFGEH